MDRNWIGGGSLPRKTDGRPGRRRATRGQASQSLLGPDLFEACPVSRVPYDLSVPLGLGLMKTERAVEISRRGWDAILDGIGDAGERMRMGMTGGGRTVGGRDTPTRRGPWGLGKELFEDGASEHAACGCQAAWSD